MIKRNLFLPFYIPTKFHCYPGIFLGTISLLPQHEHKILKIISRFTPMDLRSHNDSVFIDQIGESYSVWSSINARKEQKINIGHLLVDIDECILTAQYKQHLQSKWIETSCLIEALDKKREVEELSAFTIWTGTPTLEQVIPTSKSCKQ